MNDINDVLKNTDWALLRAQKQFLRELWKNEHFDGLIEFIDHIQDAAVDSGLVPENEVFEVVQDD